MVGSWVLSKIWIIDLFSALVGMLMSSSTEINFFFARSSFYKLRCENVIGIVLCCCHQACYLLYYLVKINNGFHIYRVTFEPLYFCFQMWLWFRICTKILADRWIWQKKGTDPRICIQSNLDYPDLDYPDFSIIRTFSLVPIL